ncbi:protein of unknown function [Shewanella benthica]|uniref:Uncharacterized protein n=1 Tax=Shewanella benthica TaxID=43661 RepID=A0A330M354_9GAMM|nr:protein of unknown function [Shewanella benthica]
MKPQCKTLSLSGKPENTYASGSVRDNS